MTIPTGMDDSKTLRQLLDDNAFNLLIGKARTLTVGDTWRLNGWALPEDTSTPNEDSVLKKLNLEEMKSVANALEQHLVNNGNDRGWKYVNPTYACGGCCGCCAVTEQPKD